MKKRVLSLALCLVLVVGLFSGLTVNASAGIFEDFEAKKKEIAEKIIKEKIKQLKEEFEIPDLDTDAIISSFTTAATSGDFGENNCLHWKVTSTFTSKTLTITGTGAMPDFDFPKGNLAPWWNYEALGMNAISEIDFDIKGNLKRVIIGDGVTNVGDYALFCLPAATQVTLPESVTRIGRYGIAMCSKLTGMSIPKGVTEIGDFGLAGNGLTAVPLPDGLQSLGRTETICDNCGEVVSTKEIPATGAHTWDNGTVTTEPTETTPGVRTFTCAVCGQTRTETIPATGAHDYQFTRNVAPTCTADGYDLYTCSGCGATEKRNSKPALGHKWDSGTVTTEPTETTPGVRTYTCTVCGEVKTETIPATGAHTHKWDAGKVTTEPTETTPGVRTYTCTICGQTKNEIIPATGGSTVCPGGPSCPSYGFRDVAGPADWSHEGIDYCVRRSLMVGTGVGTFSPDMACSRAQIV